MIGKKVRPVLGDANAMPKMGDLLKCREAAEGRNGMKLLELLT